MCRMNTWDHYNFFVIQDDTNFLSRHEKSSIELCSLNNSHVDNLGMKHNSHPSAAGGGLDQDCWDGPTRPEICCLCSPLLPLLLDTRFSFASALCSLTLCILGRWQQLVLWIQISWIQNSNSYHFSGWILYRTLLMEQRRTLAFWDRFAAWGVRPKALCGQLCWCTCSGRRSEIEALG